MMFTDGLDESAINWVKQGSDVGKSQSRSPLSENLDHKFQMPLSPLAYSSPSHHLLPPLKFHSGILGAHNTVAVSHDSSEEDDYDVSYYEHDGCESVASATWSEEPIQEPIPNSNQIKGIKQGLNRGVLKEVLQIQVPRRFSNGGMEFEDCEQRKLPLSSGRALPHSAYATPMAKLADLGTPSAPPIMDFGGYVTESVLSPCLSEKTERRNSEQGHLGKDAFSDQSKHFTKHEETEREDIDTTIGKTKVHTFQQENALDSPNYDASGQNAWQTMIAYDACINLCLNAWERNCTEAPEFLRDGCRLLRSAFGLHKFLLHPQGSQISGKTSKSKEQTFPSKAKKVVGKVRVEVRKLRIIPRRRLKDSNSMRTMYKQMGVEYVKQVSSLVKSSIKTLKLNSVTLTCEESLSCSVHLRSSIEDTQTESGSFVTLRPGTDDFHDFFPENQGDALILEVHDAKKNVQGHATILISAITDNPNEKIRWWNIYHNDNECIGKVQLLLASTFTGDETTAHMKSGPIVETLAYDLLLEAAMRAQHFHARNLHLEGPWKWILTEFAHYYGVSSSYTKLRYLSCIMNVATPTKDCLELVYEYLVPVMKARNERNLTRQEKSILMDCEMKVEGLLAEVFQNYKSLNENAPTGLSDIAGPTFEISAPALSPAVQVYTQLHDILAQDSQTILRNYLQTAASKRCRKHMLETDEYVTGNSEGFVMDSLTISTAYLKIKNLCINISNEIQTDIKIHNQHILPSSIDLPSITSNVYSFELRKRLKAFLASFPPSSPLSHVNDLLIATADFERNLLSWNISPVQGGVVSRDLFHDYIMVWIQDFELMLLDLCKAEKVPWSGVMTNYLTSPFAEEMYEKIKEMLIEYKVVISRWPQYTLILENAVSNVERAIIRALEKQYSDILTPLKDSIPKKIGMQVQKLARRQSIAIYTIPNQLGIFLNTMKRIVDVLHCKIEDVLKAWASCLPSSGDKKSSFGEQMNAITVLLRTKYKNYLQAILVKLTSNMQANRGTRLQRILEETKESDGESEIRNRMQMLSTQLSDSISNLHEVFTGPIFVTLCRGFWDRMGEIVLKFLEGRKENRMWYTGAYHALGVLDDCFASQMQRLQGNALQEKDIETPRSISEARSILSRDTTTNGVESSTYLYI